MKKLNFEQMEVLNGGQAVVSTHPGNYELIGNELTAFQCAMMFQVLGLPTTIAASFVGSPLLGVAVGVGWGTLGAWACSRQ